MINKYKNILKSVILTSLATLGTSPVPTMAAPMVVASKKESEASGENQTLSEQLNNGELMSAAEMSEAPAHGSHSSHSSHSSHKSHSSPVVEVHIVAVVDQEMEKRLQQSLVQQ